MQDVEECDQAFFDLARLAVLNRNLNVAINAQSIAAKVVDEVNLILRNCVALFRLVIDPNTVWKIIAHAGDHVDDMATVWPCMF